jgi:hypothetical protein
MKSISYARHRFPPERTQLLETELDTILNSRAQDNLFTEQIQDAPLIFLGDLNSIDEALLCAVRRGSRGNRQIGSGNQRPSLAAAHLR